MSWFSTFTPVGTEHTLTVKVFSMCGSETNIDVPHGMMVICIKKKLL